MDIARSQSENDRGSFFELSAPVFKAALSAAVRTAAVLLTLLCLSHYVRLASEMVEELHMNDFGKFYYSAALFLDGQDMYAPTPATDVPLTETESRQFLNLNPPHFHLLVLPFVTLSPGVALLLWAILNLLALIVSVRLIARELRIRWTRGRVLWTVCGVIVCSATGAIIVTGQLTFVLLVPVTLAWMWARRGNWDRAAVCLGVCASVKPFLGIFLVYLLLARRMRAAGLMIATGVACGVVGLAVFGWHAYASWLRGLSAVNWTWAAMNGGVAGVVARAFAAESPFYTPFFQMPSIVGPITNIVGAAVTAISLALLLLEEADFCFWYFV
jgi:alpha-1,2-mannosyltransferase